MIENASLKIRVYDPTYRVGTCGDLASRIVAAYNATLPEGAEPVQLLDAKWATPPTKWRNRGGGW